MNIRAKLKILSLVALIGLGLVSALTIFGLNAIHDTQETAHRRQSYVANLLEIKASALSTIILDPTQKETKDVFADAEKNIDQHGGIAIKVIRRAEVRDELKAILAQWAHYDQESRNLIKLAETDAKAASDRLTPLYAQEFKPFQAALEKFIGTRRDEAVEGIAQAEAVLSRTYWAVILLLGSVSVIIVTIVFMLSRTLRAALAGIQQQLIPLRQGDLTQRLPENTKDELGDIASGVNAFVSELQSIVHRTRDRSNQLAESAQQLASASAALLQSSTQQSDATSTVATSVEQFSTSVDQVAINATQAQQKANMSGALAQSGGTEVLSAVAEIRHIEKIVSEAVVQMESLGQQTKGIGRIVNVIKEVADQTNLLALNAAIEAARAGEAGRGFAVVADEVRKLAERTSASTHEITAMISAIQQSTETMTGMMKTGNELVVHGMKQIGHAGDSMRQITNSSNEVVGAISEISVLLSEQRIAGAEIAKNVERIARMTEQGRNTASDVSSAAEQLELLANELQQQVEAFKA